MPGKAKGSRKLRKIDRNRKRGGTNARYIAEHRHEKSHARRIRAHLERYGTAPGVILDRVAAAALKRYEIWK